MTRFNFFQLQPWKQTCHASVTCEEFALWGHIFWCSLKLQLFSSWVVSQSYDFEPQDLEILATSFDDLCNTFLITKLWVKTTNDAPSLTSNNCCMPKPLGAGEKKALCSFNMTLWRGSLKKKHDKSIRLLELVGKCWRLLSYVQKNLAFLWNQ